MRLYHGSNIDIAEIDLAISKVGKDFGCGFYLSKGVTIQYFFGTERAIKYLTKKNTL